MTVATHLDLRSAHCANTWLRTAQPLETKLGRRRHGACAIRHGYASCGYGLSGFPSKSMALMNARVPVLPKRREDGVLGTIKSSQQVCDQGNTLSVRDPARNARWYVCFGDYVRGRAGKGWAVATWLLP
eukprot:621981-Prymnesium_polylepis.1